MSGKYMFDRVKMVKQHKHSVKFNFYLCMAYSAVSVYSVMMETEETLSTLTNGLMTA